MEDCLHVVLRQMDDMGYDHDKAHMAIDTNATQALVEFLIKQIDMMRGEVRAAQQVQERAEQELRRARDELRRRDNSSHYAIEEEERRQKTPQLQDEDRLVQGLREQPHRYPVPSSNQERQDREMRLLPTPSLPTLCQPPPDAPRYDRARSFASSPLEEAHPTIHGHRERSPIPPSYRHQENPPASLNTLHQDGKRKEKKVGVLHMSYSLPSAFPPPPMIAIQPPPPPPPVFAPQSTDVDNEGEESLEDEDNIIDCGQSSTPEEEETKQERSERLACNHNWAEQPWKDDLTLQNNVNRRANLVQGWILDLVGVIQVGSSWKRDNRFRGMLSRNLYYYAQDNAVYPSCWGRRMYDWERNEREGPQPSLSCHWYHLAPHGFPRTVTEAQALVWFMEEASLSDDKQFEVWTLLSEFYRMSQAFVPEQQDHVMAWVANKWNYYRRLRNLPNVHFALVPVDSTAINPRNVNRLNQGAGIMHPQPKRGLDIDLWAQFLAHHGQPGLRNQFYGILMDHAF